MTDAAPALRNGGLAAGQSLGHAADERYKVPPLVGAPAGQPSDHVYWVVIKRFGAGMMLQGREEFLHKSFVHTADAVAGYLKRMGSIRDKAFSHFTVEIIASKE